MPRTSRLIGQAREHLPQSTQRSGAAARRSAGHPTRFRTFRPTISITAIGQKVWQNPRLPARRAKTVMKTIWP